MKFRKASAVINEKRISGYTTSNPGKEFRGMKVFLAKSSGRWEVYEKTTGSTLFPRSYPGGYSNLTREGALSIARYNVCNRSEKAWERAQEILDYPLKKSIQ